MAFDKCPLLKGKSKEEQIKFCLNCPEPRCFHDLDDNGCLPEKFKPKRGRKSKVKSSPESNYIAQ